MFTLIENKRTRRIAALILLAIAMLGPWAYDLINVPAQYSCDSPNVRLEGDFCGLPISFLMGLGALFGLLLSILSGDIAIGQDPFALALPFMLLVFIMPIFTSLYLLRHDEQARGQVFNLTAWGLAAIAAGVYLGLSRFRPHALPWGLLLYVGVALAALVLELLLLARSMFRTPPVPLAPQPRQSRSKQ